MDVSPDVFPTNYPILLLKYYISYYITGIFPTYSRAISDPVPGGAKILECHKVVIVEGNYMLNYDDELWKPLEDLFNEKVCNVFYRCVFLLLNYFLLPSPPSPPRLILISSPSSLVMML